MSFKLNSLEALMNPGLFLLPLVLKQNRRLRYRMPKNYKIPATTMCLYANGSRKKKKMLKTNFVTNVARSTIANGKSLFVVVNGHIRKWKSDGHIDFKQRVDIHSAIN